MTDIDKIVKERQEVADIEEKKKLATKELDKILDSITTERRSFEKLRKEKEKFLEERQKEALDKVYEMIQRIKKAREEIEILRGNATETIDRTDKTVKTAVDGILGLLRGSEELVERSEGLKQQYEDLLKVFQNAQLKLEERIRANGKVEKDFKNREQKVERRDKEATQKLEQAKELAFWHKEPGAKYSGE